MNYVLKIVLVGLFLNSQQVIASDRSTGKENIEFEVSSDILNIEGDAEYGEYLAGGCTGCHQTDGSYDGIPSIVGWDEETFVWAMHSYKEKIRKHPVMQMMAGRLSDEEIAALAAYFAALE